LQDIKDSDASPAKRKKTQTDITMDRLESLAVRVTELQAQAQTQQTKIIADTLREVMLGLSKAK
jgi:hypothetical protein